jgi:hypothetical protein
MVNNRPLASSSLTIVGHSLHGEGFRKLFWGNFKYASLTKRAFGSLGLVWGQQGDQISL